MQAGPVAEDQKVEEEEIIEATEVAGDEKKKKKKSLGCVTAHVDYRWLNVGKYLVLLDCDSSESHSS
ncbi:unnamed protein product [Symbiodinium pilosum]|uniref:Uncharacterized protein n=1 Tax=Symbiodinium pilosum TaxID=2952 RepID=A0A812YI39_SYMPI|nr:unnamed protein product [Symbiodinium pilosum]